MEARILLSASPISPEFLGNDSTVGTQNDAAVAADADGDFVAVWTSDHTGDSEIFAQRYDRDGVAQGSEFRVNNTTASTQLDASAAMNANGSFVIVWSSFGQDTDGWGVFGQRFDANGVAQGSEFQVNTTFTGDQNLASVAIDASGNFVVTWTGSDGNGQGVIARRFDNLGNPLSGETPVNTFTTGDQGYSQAAMNAAGDFVVTWQSDGQDGSGLGVFAQRYTSAGVAQGGEFQVNTFTTGAQGDPSLAMDSAGNFVATWTSATQDSDGSSGVYAQRFNANGVRLGGEFRVNDVVPGDQEQASVAMRNDGYFAIAWQSSNGQDGDQAGVYVKEYNAAGEVQGAAVLANTTSTGNQQQPSLAIDDDQDFVVVWSGNGTGDADGMFARRFNTNFAPVAVNDAYNVNQDTPLNVPLVGSILNNDTDLDGNSLTTLLIGNVTNGSLALNANGSFNYTPNPGYVGTDTFTYRANDGTTTGNLGKVLIHVNQTSAATAGAEVRVNTTTANIQQTTADTPRVVATGGNGDYVMAWASNLQDGSGWGVYAQRYNYLGVAQGGEILVMTTTTGDQINPAVAMEYFGDFIVVWESADAGGTGIYAQLFDEDGSKSGGQFQVNTTTVGNQSNATVAQDFLGSFVVAWESDDGSSTGIYGRRYQSNGAALTGEFLVNTTTAGQQRGASAAMDRSGDFVITWESQGQDGSGWGVYAQRFDELAVKQGGEIQVHTTTANDQRYADVAVDEVGNFVVTWSSFGQDGSGYGVYARRFDNTGTAQSGEFQVNTFTTGDQQSSSVSRSYDGEFVISWSSMSQDGDNWGVYVQEYDAAGATRGGEKLVNSTTFGSQANSSVALDNDGDFVVVWSGNGTGDASGVFARRFETDLAPTGQGDTYGVTQGTALTVAAVGVVSNDQDLDNDTLTATLVDNVSNGALVFNANGSFIYTPNAGFIGTDQFTYYADDGAFETTVQTVTLVVGPGPGAVGAETRVNTSTSNTQDNAKIARDAAGNYVVVWDKSGSGDDVYAQRYNAAGVAQGAEFRVNPTTADDQRYASVAKDAAGNFVVTWTSDNQDGSGEGVYARRYAANGTALSGEFRVNTTTTGDQSSSNVVVDPVTGNFVITWTQESLTGTWSIMGQQYSAAGAALGGEFQISSAVDFSFSPNAAIDATGTFTVIWTAISDNGWGIFARRYDASGNPLGGEFQVSTNTTATAFLSYVGMDAASGNFVIAWSDFGSEADAPSEGNIFIRRYDASGNPLTGEVRANSYTTSTQWFGGVAMAPGGDFVVAWASSLQDGSSYGVYAQQYDANGLPVGAEFRVNTTTTNSQSGGQVAVDALGNYVITWSGNGPGDTSGVFFQRYEVVPVADDESYNVDEDASLNVAAGSGVLVGDSDPNGQPLTAVLVSNVTNGSLVLNANGSFTYTPNANFDGQDTFVYKASDGTRDSNYATVAINVGQVNDAPVLDNSGTMTLSMNEDDPNPAGDTVATLIVSAGGNRITDVDTGPEEGIALTGVANTNGTWQYSTNSGSSWNAFGAVSNTSAVLLDATALVRFIPNANFSGTGGTITFRAWDHTSGSNGQTGVDVSTNGGATAFSTATETATATVTPVNDAPVITSDGGGATAGMSRAENQTAVTTVTSTDVDGGALSYSTIGGADAALFSINAGTGVLTFNAAPDFEAAADAGANNVYDVTVQVSDGNGGTDTQQISVTVTDVFEAGISVSAISGNTTEAGGTATFTVVLDSAPTADVTIGLSSSDATEGTAAPASVTFTAANWNVAQTVTVTGVNDFLPDGDIGYTIVTAAAVSADAGYIGLDASDVSVTNTDNDTAGITVSPTSGLTTTEAGGMATFTVVLDTQPNADVTIVLLSSDITEGTVNSPSLTFTAANWNVAQTVTVTGVNDFLPDGDIGYTIVTAAAVSADAGYIGLDASDVSVTNTDNAPAGITVTPTSGLTTTEAGATATFTVVLNSQPTADVTVGLSSSNTAEGTVSPGSLTFTNDNWNVAQTVTITGVDDFVTDGNINYTIITAAATSADANYNGLNANDVSVTNNDSNSEPVLNPAASPMLIAENEDAGAPVGAVGTLVANLVDFPGGGGLDNVTDPDAGALLGIAITGADTTNGNWWYSTNSGTSWNALGAVNDSNARLLAADAGTRLYFQPNANYNGTMGAAVTFHAWDQTSGAAGGTALVSSTVLDQFSATSYSNNDGSTSWSADWVENDSLGGGVGAGRIQVKNTGELDIHAKTVGDLIYREANLSGANSATLSLTYDNNFNGTDGVFIQISNDGGANYTNLTGGEFSSTVNAGIGTLSFDITPSISANTTIRFYVNGSGTGNHLYLDNVQISYRFSDGSTAFSTASDTASLTVNPVNDAPVATNDSYNVNEDGTLNVAASGVRGNDTDIDGNPLTAVLGSTTSNGSLTLNADGSFSYTPNPDFWGVDTFTYHANDGLTDSNTATVTITVNPVAGITVTPTSGLVTTKAGGTATFDVVLISRPTADVIIGISSNDGTEGAVSVGSLTFTPGNWNTAQTVTATGVDDFVDDGNIAYTIVTAAATSADANYNGLNPADVSVTNTDNDTAGITVSAISGDTTEGGGTATFTIVLDSQPTADVTIGISSNDTTEGTVSMSSLTFTATDWNLAQTVTVTGVNDFLTDGNVSYTIITDPATSSDANYNGLNPSDVSVTNQDGVNDAPVNSVPGAQSTSEDIALVFSSAGGNLISINDMDAGSNPVQVTLSGTNGTVTLGGTTGLSFSSGDGTADAIMTFTGMLTDINAALAGMGFVPTANFSGAASLAITTNDQGNSGSGGAQSDYDSVSITVNPVNDPPTLSDAAFSLSENSPNGTSVSTVTATDPDTGDVRTYSITAGNTVGAFAINASTGEITVANSAPVDFETTPTFTLTVLVQDLAGATDTATVTINLSNVNEFSVGPISDTDAAADAVAENAAAGTAVGITALADDLDGPDTVSYSLDDDDGGRFAINAVTGVVTVGGPGAPGLDREAAASHNITVRGTSSDGSFSTQTFTINLNDVDEFDVGGVSDTDATADAVAENAANGTTVGITAFADDPDAGDTVTYSLDDNSGGRFAINATTGVVTVADGTLLDRESAASHTITVRATSGDGSFTTRGFTVAVLPVNDNAPVITSPNSASVAENTGSPVLTVTATDADLPAQSINYSISGGVDASKFAINATSGALTFGTAPDFEIPTDANADNVYEVQVTVDDGAGSTANQLIRVTVTPVNEAPAASSDSYLVNEDTTLNVAAAGVLTNDSDVDGNPLSAAFISGPSNAASFSLNADGSFSYTPNANFNGIDSFTYRANDGTANSNVVTVTITVNAMNDAPVAVGDSYSVNEDGTLSVTAAGVLANDSDVEGGPLTTVLVTGPMNGTLVLNANGSYVYTPYANFNGIDSFQYRASDGSQNSNLAIVTIAVNPVNDAPMGTSDSFSVAEDGVLAVPAAGVLANDGDIDGDTLTAVLVNGPSSGTLNLELDGSFTYSPDPDFNGTDSFRYRARDGSLNSNVTTVAITVNAVNDAPAAKADNYTVEENATLMVPANGVLRNDSDPDGDSISVVIVSGPANGTLGMGPNGSFLYQPAPGFKGTDSFSYRATDGSLQSGVVTVKLTVRGQISPIVPNPTPEPDDPGPPAELPPAEPPVEPPTGGETPPDESTGPPGTPPGGQTAPPLSIDRPGRPLPLTGVDTSLNTAVNLSSTTLAAIDRPVFESESDRAYRTLSNLARGRDVLTAAANPAVGLASIIDTDALAGDLAALKNLLQVNSTAEEIVIGSALASAIGLSIGYVFWIIRGGYLVTSLLTSMPAWRLVDPLPVLEYMDDDETGSDDVADRETLATMLDKEQVEPAEVG